jgi:acetyltransferase
MAETTNPNMMTYTVSDERHELDAIMRPQNVAVIGATERQGSVGRTILWNLISSPFGGAVFPVTPTRNSVLGIHAYPTITDVPEKVDLAVIVTPAKTVPGIIQECVDVGISGAIIISAGFKETGPEGAELERQILEIARGKMRIIGPNCLGVMMPRYGLNATFAKGMGRPGNVAFISQSGAICTAVLDKSFEENVGFSAFISIGSMLDVGWGDLIYYLGDDPHTNSIVIYMESIGDARAFMSAAREVALTKPIIIIKAGRTEAAAAAAASHTGSLTGSDDVLVAAFRRVGVLRVDQISDIFDMSEVLAKQPRARGPRLTIVTNAGGPGVLATDALITGGGQLAELSGDTMEKLNSILPSAWSRNNPIDILGDADPDRYAQALEIAAQDPNNDGLLVILTPQDMTDPTQTAEALRKYAKIENKPVLASWMGGAEVAAGERILNRANIPTFEYPDTAVRMFNYLWRYNYNLRALYETPRLPQDSYGETPNRALVRQIIDRARSEGRTILTEAESKQVIAAYNIPTTPIEVAETPDEAVAAAEKIGYPVVLKIHSRTITHKTDVGGVLLNIQDADGVRRGFETIRENVSTKASAEHFHGVSIQPMVKFEGYEIIVGSSIDSQFGPVILFGQGGTLVEVNKDKALGLPPLTTTLARRMMEQTKIYEALHGIRGRAAIDLIGLEKIMVRFSQIVVEQPWIKEMDLNPMLASPERLLALDARVVLHEPDTDEADLPLLAIRPYPTAYEREWMSIGGERVMIRPIRPEDEPLMVKFHETLSERTVYMRYFSAMKLGARTTHDRLSRLSFIDYDREIALVATTIPNDGSAPLVLGIGRLTKAHGRPEAEFGLVISDQFQRQGLGTELLKELVEIGRKENLQRITGFVLPDNSGMLRITEELGFKHQFMQDDNVMKVVREL